jgi:hypothetical protein
MKHFLPYVLAMLVLLIGICIGTYSKAAGPYWQSSFTYNQTTETVTYSFNVPKAKALFYNRIFGTAELKSRLDQTMYGVRSQIENAQEEAYSRGARLLRSQYGDSYQFSYDMAVRADSTYQDTVGTFARTHPINP